MDQRFKLEVPLGSRERLRARPGALIEIELRAGVSGRLTAEDPSERLRACASRRSWAAAGAAVPAIVGPGAADEPATDNGGIGQR
jgi:hypothetical protein